MFAYYFYNDAAIEFFQIQHLPVVFHFFSVMDYIKSDLNGSQWRVLE